MTNKGARRMFRELGKRLAMMGDNVASCDEAAEIFNIIHRNSPDEPHATARQLETAIGAAVGYLATDIGGFVESSALNTLMKRAAELIDGKGSN